jgi:hypothetical protein
MEKPRSGPIILMGRLCKQFEVFVKQYFAKGFCLKWTVRTAAHFRFPSAVRGPVLAPPCLKQVFRAGRMTTSLWKDFGAILCWLLAHHL